MTCHLSVLELIKIIEYGLYTFQFGQLMPSDSFIQPSTHEKSTMLINCDHFVTR